MKAINTVLARSIKNPVVRSAVVNLEVSVAVAVLSVLTAETTGHGVDVHLIIGAASAAFLKWVHSTASNLLDRVEAAAPVEAPTA